MEITTTVKRPASATTRALRCPGCFNECAKYTHLPQVPNDSAIQGTHEHALLQKVLEDHLWSEPPAFPKPSDYLGQWIDDDEGGFAVTAREEQKVMIAIAYVYSHIRTNPQLRVLVEQRVDIGTAHQVPHWTGRADVVLIDAENQLLEVIDYKSGYYRIPPNDPQLISYALGVVNDSSLLEQSPPIQKIKTTVIQPQNATAPVNSCVYERGVFDQEAAVVIQAMLDSMPIDAPRVPGRHCKYCLGAKVGRCPEYTQSLTSTLENPIMKPLTKALPIQIPDISPADYTPIQLAGVLDAIPVIREWLKEVEEVARKSALQGRSIPGYKLTESSAPLAWIPDLTEPQIKKKLGSMGLKKDVYIKEIIRTPTQVSALPEVKDWTDRKKANLQKLMWKPSRNVTLAKIKPGETQDQSPRQLDLFDEVPPAVSQGEDEQKNFPAPSPKPLAVDPTEEEFTFL